MTRTITLNGLTVTPSSPRPFVASQIQHSAPSSPIPEGDYDSDYGARVVAVAAALYACWPEGTRWPGIVRPAGFPLTRVREFGATVIDDLTAAGCTVGDILRAGTVCWVDVVIPMVAKQQAAEAAALGNSEGPAEPQSAASCESSESTG